MIGSNIQELRKKKGLSLSELAERTSISKSYLSNIERNLNQNPSIHIIKKLALVLDVDLKVLLKTNMNEEIQPCIESEWLEFVNKLKRSGIEKEQIHEYMPLIEFIKWNNRNSETKE